MEPRFLANVVRTTKQSQVRSDSSDRSDTSDTDPQLLSDGVRWDRLPPGIACRCNQGRLDRTTGTRHLRSGFGIVPVRRVEVLNRLALVRVLPLPQPGRSLPCAAKQGTGGAVPDTWSSSWVRIAADAGGTGIVDA